VIKARAGELRILGLTDENLQRLREGQPILFDNDWEGETGKTAIIYGKDEQALTDTLGTMAKFPTVKDEEKH